MRIQRSFKTELCPNNKQRTLLLKGAGVARFVWNWALSRRKQEYAESGKSSGAYKQSKQLNAIKRTDFPWMYEVSKCACNETLRDLDKAYRNFWRGLKTGNHVGLPKFKRKRNGIGSFRVQFPIHVFESEIQLPKLGRIRLKERNYIPTEGIKILSATCSERAGRWFVSVNCEVEIPDPVKPVNPIIGIDLGIKTLATVSDGRKFENPRSLQGALKHLCRLQRELSRRTNGSNNREKTRKKLARLHYRISCIRKNALHQATSAVVKTKPSAIVLEDLSVKGMLKARRLARAISDVGMYEFRRQITYKSAWNGIQVIIAPRYYPSSKKCSVCGQINHNLILADREWTCECGAQLDRDLNAALNLSTAKFAGSDACGDCVRPASVGSNRRNRNNPAACIRS